MTPDFKPPRVRDRWVQAPDGRALLIQEGGDPAGSAVLVHLGTPSSRILYRRHLLDAAERGIRLISYDRPGYGGSTGRPGRAIADCAADVRAIVDSLRIERLAVWGISGGGPHALACASLLQDRVVAAATLASPAPYDAEGLNWFAGQGQDNIDDGKLMLNDPAAARAKFENDRQALLDVTSADLLAVNPTLYSPTDAEALTDDLDAYYALRNRDGLAPGIEGWWDDSAALLKPWEFSLEAIQIPVMVWQGRQDRFVPFQHGEWLVKHLRNVDAHLTDDDGHLTLLQHRVPIIHAWLIAHF